MSRQPTIVVSPVGWEGEVAEGEGEGDDEDGYTARALYDYQAAAPDEISFDPDDIITNIVMVRRLQIFYSFTRRKYYIYI